MGGFRRLINATNKCMNKGVIIFARMSSSRLPGKMLKKIGNREILGHVIDRAKLIKTKAQLVVATSNRKDDDVLADSTLKI